MASKTFLQEGGIIVAEWTLTSADPTGTELVLPYHTDICVSFEDTFGTATAVLEGKNHPVVATGAWFPLTDLDAQPISKTAAGIEQVREAPFMIRPNLSIPGAGASVTVRIKATRSR